MLIVLGYRAGVTVRNLEGIMAGEGLDELFDSIQRVRPLIIVIRIFIIF